MHTPVFIREALRRGREAETVSAEARMSARTLRPHARKVQVEEYTLERSGRVKRSDPAVTPSCLKDGSVPEVAIDETGGAEDAVTRGSDAVFPKSAIVVDTSRAAPSDTEVCVDAIIGRHGVPAMEWLGWTPWRPGTLVAQAQREETSPADASTTTQASSDPSRSLPALQNSPTIEGRTTSRLTSRQLPAQR